VLDWRLTASLAKAQREALVAIAMGGLTLDAQQIGHALAALGMREAEGRELVDIVERSLDGLVGSGRPVGFDWLVGLLDALALHGATGFGEQLAVFRKTWLSLSGVIRDLGAGVAADVPLLSVGLRQFVAEWPARLFALPDSRAFATHVSNADLARLAASSWPTTLRYWARLARALSPSSASPPPGASSTRPRADGPAAANR
jgi:ubiquinone biosynthesis protein